MEKSRPECERDIWCIAGGGNEGIEALLRRVHRGSEIPGIKLDKTPPPTAKKLAKLCGWGEI
jgi:hypothetical protein